MEKWQLILEGWNNLVITKGKVKTPNKASWSNAKLLLRYRGLLVRE